MDAALRRVSMLDGLQGNVVTGYRHPHALYVFARVRDPDSARQWLEDERQHVTSYRGSEHNPTRVTLNVAFTYKGLRRLGVPELRTVWPPCPAELSRVALKMMQKQPADRQ